MHTQVTCKSKRPHQASPALSAVPSERACGANSPTRVGSLLEQQEQQLKGRRRAQLHAAVQPVLLHAVAAVPHVAPADRDVGGEQEPTGEGAEVAAGSGAGRGEGGGRGRWVDESGGGS